MAFINAIVNSPEDLEHRALLRNEFMDLGIHNVLPELRKMASPELDTQLNIFEEEAEADNTVINETLNVDYLELTDPDELFNSIKETIQDPETFGWFLRVLQNILLIPTDAHRRYVFYCFFLKE